MTTNAASIAVEQSMRLEDLVKGTKQCRLYPMCFFVAWQGVLTVAFQGFPAAVQDLKAKIGELFVSLPKENPGSMWPKVTLGALRNGQRLTPQQLDTLRTICREESAAFEAMTGKQHAAMLHSMSVVLYQCRSLERLLSQHSVDLQSTADGASATAAMTVEAKAHDNDGASAVDAAERERVRAIVQESNESDYWFHASKDGNREAHYRGQACGATLVSFLQLPVGHPLEDAIRVFCARVDEELGGMYCWFDASSWHVTVRALL